MRFEGRRFEISDIRHQTSDIRLQTSDFRCQTERGRFKEKDLRGETVRRQTIRLAERLEMTHPLTAGCMVAGDFSTALEMTGMREI